MNIEYNIIYIIHDNIINNNEQCNIMLNDYDHYTTCSSMQSPTMINKIQNNSNNNNL